MSRHLVPRKKLSHKYITRCTHSCRAPNRFHFDTFFCCCSFLLSRHCSHKNTIKNLFLKICVHFMEESNSYRHVFATIRVHCAKMWMEKLNGTEAGAGVDAVYQYHTVNASIPYQMNYDYYILAHSSAFPSNKYGRIYMENIDHHLNLCKFYSENAQIVNIIPTNYTKLTEWKKEINKYTKEFGQSQDQNGFERIISENYRTFFFSPKFSSKPFLLCTIFLCKFDFFSEHLSYGMSARRSNETTAWNGGPLNFIKINFSEWLIDVENSFRIFNKVMASGAQSAAYK